MEFFEYIDLLDQPFDIFYTASATSPTHWHYYCEILCMKRGRIRLVCDDKSYLLEENDLCYIYPLQLHGFQKVDEEDVEYAVIKFDIHTIHIPKAYVQRIYDYFVRHDADSDKCIFLKNIAVTDNRLLQLIHSTVSESIAKQELFGLQIQSNIYSILISIARLSPQSSFTENNRPSEGVVSFYHVLEYIDTHSAEPIEIQELADRCHLSYSHFAKLFRENYGRSCKEYINYIRLNKAEELLMHTNYDISYIANETGFFDSSHFIRAYKKWKGITPKQQRLHYSDT